jgi:hypothetical protein
MLALLKAIAGPIISGVTGVIQKRQDRKAKEQEANAAWEASMGRSMENGWKDEYVTVMVTLPLLQIFIGNLLSIWFPEKGQAILAANQASLTQIGTLMDTAYGQVMMVVVLAAVGIKGAKALWK